MKAIRSWMKVIVGIFMLAGINTQVFAAKPPATLWEVTYGGTSSDYGYSVQQTTDGGYIIAGYTSSFGAGKFDVYLIKSDASGHEEWSQTYGGSGDDMGYSVQQTTDGGYIISGTTYSFGAVYGDVYLIKTDAEGNKEWSQTYGGTATDMGYSVQQTTDGGYIIAGANGSDGGDVYLIKTDAEGNEEWSQTYGGANSEEGYSVQQTTDGGYIIAGYTYSSRSAGSEVYLIKTDASGSEEWSQTYGGTIDDYYGNSVQQTTDGGYIIAGYTSDPYWGEWSYVYLVKADASGNEEWSRTYGNGSYQYDYGSSVQQTTDGGYIIAGDTWPSGSGDVYLIKTDAEGNKEWSQTYGGTSSDMGFSVQQTTDGGYIIAGRNGSGGGDVYLIKTDAEAAIALLTPRDGESIPASPPALFSWQADASYQFKIQFSSTSLFPHTSSTLSFPLHGWMTDTSTHTISQWPLLWDMVGNIAEINGIVYWRVIGKSAPQAPRDISEVRSFTIAPELN